MKKVMWKIWGIVCDFVDSTKNDKLIALLGNVAVRLGGSYEKFYEIAVLDFYDDGYYEDCEND